MATKQLPLPAHYDPKRIGEVRKVDYGALFVSANGWAKKYGLQPAASDKKRIALMGIDQQSTFCIPGFELYVGGRTGTGALDDSMRFAEFIYRNLGVVSQIFLTMDTHTLMQIFHPMFWVNDRGESPAPFTLISLADLKESKWRVNPAVVPYVSNAGYAYLQQYALHYATRLSQGGRYDLTIWPFHGMLGGIGHAIVPAIEEAVFFHAVSRASQTGYEIKGGNAVTENYSVLGPEVRDGPKNEPVGQRNTRFIEKLLSFDMVVIAGQAKSHCVAWTIHDLLDEIMAKDPALVRKVYIMTDCSSPVVVPGVIDYTDAAEAAMKQFADAGMHVVKSTDAIDSWPDVNL